MPKQQTTEECQCTCYWCILEAPKHDMCNWGCKLPEEKPKAKNKRKTNKTFGQIIEKMIKKAGHTAKADISVKIYKLGYRDACYDILYHLNNLKRK